MDQQNKTTAPQEDTTPREGMPTSPQPSDHTLSTTKLYENTSNKTIDLTVIGVGEVPAGGRFSLSGQYHPVIILENYPGLVDITDQTNTQEETTNE